jgi:hypothetical protein
VIIGFALRLMIKRALTACNGSVPSQQIIADAVLLQALLVCLIGTFQLVPGDDFPALSICLVKTRFCAGFV